MDYNSTISELALLSFRCDHRTNKSVTANYQGNDLLGPLLLVDFVWHSRLAIKLHFFLDGFVAILGVFQPRKTIPV
jgi:hypothetical protein